jgi:hypothetical protein
MLGCCYGTSHSICFRHVLCSAVAAVSAALGVPHIASHPVLGRGSEPESSPAGPGNSHLVRGSSFNALVGSSATSNVQGPVSLSRISGPHASPVYSNVSGNSGAGTPVGIRSSSPARGCLPIGILSTAAPSNAQPPALSSSPKGLLPPSGPPSGIRGPNSSGQINAATQGLGGTSGSGGAAGHGSGPGVQAPLQVLGVGGAGGSQGSAGGLPPVCPHTAPIPYAGPPPPLTGLAASLGSAVGLSPSGRAAAVGSAPEVLLNSTPAVLSPSGRGGALTPGTSRQDGPAWVTEEDEYCSVMCVVTPCRSGKSKKGKWVAGRDVWKGFYCGTGCAFHAALAGLSFRPEYLLCSEVSGSTSYHVLYQHMFQFATHPLTVLTS